MLMHNIIIVSFYRIGGIKGVYMCKNITKYFVKLVFRSMKKRQRRLVFCVSSVMFVGYMVLGIYNYVCFIFVGN